jgi:hypothetical protein
MGVLLLVMALHWLRLLPSVGVVQLITTITASHLIGTVDARDLRVPAASMTQHATTQLLLHRAVICSAQINCRQPLDTWLGPHFQLNAFTVNSEGAGRGCNNDARCCQCHHSYRNGIRRAKVAACAAAAAVAAYPWASGQIAVASLMMRPPGDARCP